MEHSQEHLHAVETARIQMPRSEHLFALSDLYKLFGDSTRLRILFALKAGELCVGAISELIGMEQSAVSHQLRTLRAGNLITCRQSGKTRLYSLSDEHVQHILSVGMEHLEEKI